MHILVSLVLMIAALTWHGAALAQGTKQPLVIGTGATVGIYYAAGGGLCRILNRYRHDSSLICAAETTGGSAANVEAVRTKDVALGLVQSDIQAAAYRGEGNFTGRAYSGLRSLFSLH